MPSTLAGTPVLVTGATGFIGSRLAEWLATRESAAVTGTGRRLDRVAWLRDRGVGLLSVDLEDRAALANAVRGQRIVFHVAAVLAPDPEKAEAANVEGTGSLVRLAAEAGAERFVHTSTAGVYDMSGAERVDESTPLALDHSAAYPRTKARSEKLAFDLGRELGLEVTAVRPSQVYGPGFGIWTVGMLQAIQAGKPVYLGDGSAHFNPVYVDDVVDAMVRCATSERAADEAFNLSAEVTTWREYMAHLGRLAGKEVKGLPLWTARLLVWADRLPFVHTGMDLGFLEMATARKRFPIDKARDLLGWEPKTSLEEGMERTARWLGERGLVGAREAGAISGPET